MRRVNETKVMDKIRVIIDNKQKKVKIPTGIRMLVRRCCNAVLQMEQVTGSVEVNVAFVDDDEILTLNSKFRNVNASTDVLSFSTKEEDGEYDVNPETGAHMLGEIVISLERAVRQAEDYGHTLQREVGYLTAHSMLHLLGYDHVGGGLDAVHMREKEELIMNRLGYPRSYSYTE